MAKLNELPFASTTADEDLILIQQGGGDKNTNKETLLAEVAKTSDLGTAATHNVQTSPTDTTPNQVLKVGAGGVLGRPSASSERMKEYGQLSILQNDGTSPFGSFRAATLHLAGLAGSRRHALMFMDDGPEPSIKYQYQNDLGVQPEVELYHTGNLNTLEFAAASVYDLIATGYADSSTTAIFELYANLYNQPSSLSWQGSFYIDRAGGTQIANGITSIPINSASTGRKIILYITGLSGLTTGEVLRLGAETSTAKITVNP